jgi:hypothetical protein
LGVQNGRAEAQPHVQKGGARVAHGGHAQDARRSLQHSTKHVVGDGVVNVGRIFGPCTCRIGSWAQKQSCSPRNALQLLFKDHGHFGSRLVCN